MIEKFNVVVVNTKSSCDPISNIDKKKIIFEFVNGLMLIAFI